MHREDPEHPWPQDPSGDLGRRDLRVLEGEVGNHVISHLEIVDAARPQNLYRRFQVYLTSFRPSAEIYIHINLLKSHVFEK